MTIFRLYKPLGLWVFKAILTFLIFAQITTKVAGQQRFPINLEPGFINAPITGYMNEFGEVRQMDMAFYATLEDPIEASKGVIFRITIQKGFTPILVTDINGPFNPTPLVRGNRTIIDGSILAPYLQARSFTRLSGSGAIYPLPEGFYQFSLEVIDPIKKVALSQKVMRTIEVKRYNPPFLNTPENDASFLPGNSIFSYLFAVQPTNFYPGANIEYEFDIREVPMGIANINDNFLTFAPVYNTKVDQTNFFYTQNDPQLLTGKTYAWRVRVRDKNLASKGLSGYEAFNNNGYSEVRSFYIPELYENGDKVKIGAFDLTLGQVQTNRITGEVSGSGKVKVPFLNTSLKVYFDNLLIRDAVVVSGEALAKQSSKMYLLPYSIENGDNKLTADEISTVRFLLQELSRNKAHSDNPTFSDKNPTHLPFIYKAESRNNEEKIDIVLAKALFTPGGATVNTINLSRITRVGDQKLNNDIEALFHNPKCRFTPNGYSSSTLSLISAKNNNSIEIKDGFFEIDGVRPSYQYDINLRVASLFADENKSQPLELGFEVSDNFESGIYKLVANSTELYPSTNLSAELQIIKDLKLNKRDEAGYIDFNANENANISAALPANFTGIILQNFNVRFKQAYDLKNLAESGKTYYQTESKSFLSFDLNYTLSGEIELNNLISVKDDIHLGNDIATHPITLSQLKISYPADKNKATNTLKGTINIYGFKGSIDFTGQFSYPQPGLLLTPATASDITFIPMGLKAKVDQDNCVLRSNYINLASQGIAYYNLSSSIDANFSYQFGVDQLKLLASESSSSTISQFENQDLLGEISGLLRVDGEALPNRRISFTPSSTLTGSISAGPLKSSIVKYYTQDINEAQNVGYSVAYDVDDKEFLLNVRNVFALRDQQPAIKEINLTYQEPITLACACDQTNNPRSCAFDKENFKGNRITVPFLDIEVENGTSSTNNLHERVVEALRKGASALDLESDKLPLRVPEILRSKMGLPPATYISAIKKNGNKVFATLNVYYQKSHASVLRFTGEVELSDAGFLLNDSKLLLSTNTEWGVKSDSLILLRGTEKEPLSFISLSCDKPSELSLTGKYFISDKIALIQENKNAIANFKFKGNAQDLLDENGFISLVAEVSIPKFVIAKSKAEAFGLSAEKANLYINKALPKSLGIRKYGIIGDFKLIFPEGFYQGTKKEPIELSEIPGVEIYGDHLNISFDASKKPTETIFDFGKINLRDWKMALHNLSIELGNGNEDNDNVQFSGKILLPLIKDDQNDAFDFKATVNSSKIEFDITESITKIKPRASFLNAAKLSLSGSNNIAVNIYDSKKVGAPYALLNGNFTFADYGGFSLNLPFEFQDFQLNSASTKVAALSLGMELAAVSIKTLTQGDDEKSKMNSWPISIYQPNLYTSEDHVHFDIGMGINLVGDSSKSGFVGEGYFQFRYNVSTQKAQLLTSKFDLAGSFGPISGRGTLTFFNEDQVYGRGIEANVGLNISLAKSEINVQAYGIFGGTNQSFNLDKSGYTSTESAYRYFGFSIFGSAEPGIQLGPTPLYFSGVGAGFYYNMNREILDPLTDTREMEAQLNKLLAEPQSSDTLNKPTKWEEYRKELDPEALATKSEESKLGGSLAAGSLGADASTQDQAFKDISGHLGDGILNDRFYPRKSSLGFMLAVQGYIADPDNIKMEKAVIGCQLSTSGAVEKINLSVELNAFKETTKGFAAAELDLTNKNFNLQGSLITEFKAGPKPAKDAKDERTTVAIGRAQLTTVFSWKNGIQGFFKLGKPAKNEMAFFAFNLPFPKTKEAPEAKGKLGKVEEKNPPKPEGMSKAYVISEKSANNSETRTDAKGNQIKVSTASGIIKNKKQVSVEQKEAKPEPSASEFSAEGMAAIRAYLYLGNMDADPVPTAEEVLGSNFGNLSDLNLNSFTMSPPPVGSFAAQAGLQFDADFASEFLIFYGDFATLFRMDLAYKKLSRQNIEMCENKNGINGYILQGRILGGLDLNLGIQVKTFFYSGKYSILQAKMAAGLTGYIMDPTYVAGFIKGKYSILSGLVSGKFNYQFEVGDNCLTQAKLNPVSDINMISDVFPNENTSEMAIYEDAKVTLNVVNEHTYSFAETLGNDTEPKSLYSFKFLGVKYLTGIDKATFDAKDASEKLKIMKASIGNTAAACGCDINGFDSEGQRIQGNRYEAASIDCKDDLQPNMDYLAVFYGKWMKSSPGTTDLHDYTYEGEPVVEFKSVDFKSGPMPDVLNSRMFTHLNPGINQRNWSPEYKMFSSQELINAEGRQKEPIITPGSTQDYYNGFRFNNTGIKIMAKKQTYAVPGTVFKDNPNLKTIFSNNGWSEFKGGFKKDAQVQIKVSTQAVNYPENIFTASRTEVTSGCCFFDISPPQDWFNQFPGDAVFKITITRYLDDPILNTGSFEENETSNEQDITSKDGTGKNVVSTFSQTIKSKKITANVANIPELEPKVLFEYHFGRSEYNSLEEKINDLIKAHSTRPSEAIDKIGKNSYYKKTIATRDEIFSFNQIREGLDIYDRYFISSHMHFKPSYNPFRDFYYNSAHGFLSHGEFKKDGNWIYNSYTWFNKSTYDLICGQVSVMNAYDKVIYSQYTNNKFYGNYSNTLYRHKSYNAASYNDFVKFIMVPDDPENEKEFIFRNNQQELALSQQEINAGKKTMPNYGTQAPFEIAFSSHRKLIQRMYEVLDLSKNYFDNNLWQNQHVKNQFTKCDDCDVKAGHNLKYSDPWYTTFFLIMTPYDNSHDGIYHSGAFFQPIDTYRRWKYYHKLKVSVVNNWNFNEQKDFENDFMLNENNHSLSFWAGRENLLDWMDVFRVFNPFYLGGNRYSSGYQGGEDFSFVKNAGKNLRILQKGLKMTDLQFPSDTFYMRFKTKQRPYNGLDIDPLKIDIQLQWEYKHVELNKVYKGSTILNSSFPNNTVLPQ